MNNPPETRQKFFNSKDILVFLEQTIRESRVRRSATPPNQLFIEVDLGDMMVRIKTKERLLMWLQPIPTLAHSVRLARNHCKNFYPNIPVLEYVKQ